MYGLISTLAPALVNLSLNCNCFFPKCLAYFKLNLSYVKVHFKVAFKFFFEYISKFI